MVMEFFLGPSLRVLAEVLQGYFLNHIAHPKATRWAQATEDLICLIRSYLK